VPLAVAMLVAAAPARGDADSDVAPTDAALASEPAPRTACEAVTLHAGTSDARAVTVCPSDLPAGFHGSLLDAARARAAEADDRRAEKLGTIIAGGSLTALGGALVVVSAVPLARPSPRPTARDPYAGLGQAFAEPVEIVGVVLGGSLAVTGAILGGVGIALPSGTARSHEARIVVGPGSARLSFAF
jgi:hypothetical protein